jgi:thiol-disulfide isomerase/thioredoxin
MSKFFMTFIGLVAASCMFAACQSDTYHIKGSGTALTDGDILYLITDIENGIPKDTIVVKDGTFELDGQTDSVVFCILQDQHRQKFILPFFIEPGTIKIDISKAQQSLTSGQMANYKPITKVSGTPINSKWQAMSDSTAVLAQKMDQTGRFIYENNLGKDELDAKNKQIETLRNDFKNLVIEYARKNIQNELGYFIVIYYEEVIDPATLLELVNNLPEKTKQRNTIKSIRQRIEKEQATSIGNKINNFTMNDIAGKPTSIMSEIVKHKITIIDFWASWCGPCRQEMPNVVKLYNDYNSKGLGIIGISLDKKQQDWENATKNLGIKWVQLSDLEGWNNAAAKMMNVRSIPQTIIVDNKGTIIAKGLRGAELESFVQSKLK